MNIPVMHEQLFYKYFVCLFDWLGYKRHKGFWKIIVNKVSWFFKSFSSFLSFLWSINICSITHFVRFSTYYFFYCIIFLSLTFCFFSSNASLLMEVLFANNASTVELSIPFFFQYFPVTKDRIDNLKCKIKKFIFTSAKVLQYNSSIERDTRIAQYTIIQSSPISYHDICFFISYR